MKKIEICFPRTYADIYEDIFTKIFCDNVYINKWDPFFETIDNNAEIHIIFIDSASWMKDSLVRAILKMGDECKINQLLLVGFYPKPALDNTTQKNSINNLPMLGLLFDSFYVDYYQLPISLIDFKEYILNKIVLSDNTHDWQVNYNRIVKTLSKAVNLGLASCMYDAWYELDRLSGSAKLRLREEHDLKVNKTSLSEYISKLFRFQSLLDLYYLAIARRTGLKNYTYLVIEDNIDDIIESLEFISSATGDIFYATTDGDSCHYFFNLLNNNHKNLFRGQIFSWFSDQIEYSIIPKDISKTRNIIPDVILVDLILRDKNNIELNGEIVIKHIQEHFPYIPIIVVTKSEEPDVLTRCVKIRGADRVVPKRRLLRLPYTYRNYLQEEISPLLEVLDDAPVVKDLDYAQPLSMRMIGAYRTWNTSPGILWHGEKTMHAVEHSLEHSKGLWKLANELLVVGWKHINKDQKYTPNELFRFLMSIWLHDIGSKGSEGYQMADQVRERHSWISGELLHRNPELYMLKRGKEADIIELLCSYHQSCAPFWKRDKTKDTVKGLFHQSLEEIEEASKWNLMEWAALLRLLDSIDHNWRRVGNKQLYESKKATIAIDSKYYRERADISADARRYADWLDSQDEHMKRHMSVMNVTMKTKLIADTLLFWPEFEFASHSDAKKYLGEIGCYVLKEWFASGDVIEKRMKMRLPKDDEIKAFVNDRTYGIYLFEEYSVIDNEIQELKKNLGNTALNNIKTNKKISELERERKEQAWELWSAAE